jgi:hypothetical protein
MGCGDGGINDTVWLSQAKMVELFGQTKQKINCQGILDYLNKLDDVS